MLATSTNVELALEDTGDLNIYILALDSSLIIVLNKIKSILSNLKGTKLVTAEISSLKLFSTVKRSLL